MMKPDSRLRGSALLSALFIMTLVAIVATAMSVRLQGDIFRTTLAIDNDRMNLATDAVTFWAMDLLDNPENRFLKTMKNGVVAVYPENLQGLCPGIRISGYLVDMQSRYNINNLGESKYRPMFWRLLTLALPKTPANTKQLVALSLQHWISPYNPDKGLDALDAGYLRENPAYQASHIPFRNLSELRLVAGINAQIWQELTPWLSALPESAPLNVNTASPKMLGILGLKESQIRTLLQKREENGIRKMEALTDLLKKNNIAANSITLQSAWFLSVAKVQLGEASLIKYVLFQRSKDRKKGVTVRILSESLNTP